MSPIPAPEDPLEDLVFQILERAESDGPAALEAVCAEHPAHASSLRERVRGLAGAGLVQPAVAMPARLGDFRLLRPLGQGGMGVVYEAEQVSLGRRVALKLVRPDQLYFPGARERFRREVEAVARLSHPGIVPVHAVGEEDGVPFYAMELVAGVPLSEALDSLGAPAAKPARELSGSDLREAVRSLCAARGIAAGPQVHEPLFEGGWVESCLWLARDVAQALEHAHERGVLHRDVKPSNVLVTPAGGVRLVDFGLASTQKVSKLTRAGSRIGSLPYMAPEQVRGEAERVGPRTDVYAVGALLYELLTLRLPFPEREPSALERRIAEGRPERPRRLNPALPADAELVCLTAMELDPERRYASAAHLARDLSNVLQHRPIEARPLSSVLRARRWAQRRPAAATALALGALAAVGGPLGFGVQEARARGRIESERDAAELSLGAALDAIELLLEKVGHRDLRDVPQVEELRHELLARATDLYDRLERTRSDDRLVRLRLARATSRLARLRREIGAGESPAPGFDAAEARLRALLAEQEGDAEVRLELGNHLMFAAVARGVSAGIDEALAPAREAVALLRSCAAADPPARRPRADLARALEGLAHFLHVGGRDGEAREAYREAEELAAELRSQDPLEADALELWATAVGRIASLDQSEGRAGEAEEGFERCLQALEEAPARSAFGRQLLVLCSQSLARIRSKREDGKPDPEVDRALAAALAEQERLVAEFPRSTVHSASLAVLRLEIGERAFRARDAPLARDEFETAAELLAAVVKREPRNLTALRHLSIVANRLANAERALGDLELAERAAEESAARKREVARLAPESSPYGLELTEALALLAEIRAQRGDAAGCAEAARELSEAHPEPGWGPINAARWLVAAADAAQAGGADGAAAELRVEAVRALRQALELDRARAGDIARKIQSLGLSRVEGAAELLESTADAGRSGDPGL